MEYVFLFIKIITRKAKSQVFFFLPILSFAYLRFIYPIISQRNKKNNEHEK